MPTAATQYPVPSPINASFVNGEFAVGLGAAPGAPATRFFSRNFMAQQSGVYLFKLWLRDGGVIRMGRNAASLADLFVVPANQVTETQIYLRKGVNRIDIETVASAAACFAMLIHYPDSVLYASTALGWVFDTTEMDDGEVPAAIDPAMPVFTVLPNWEDGITERLSYLTDILVSETAVEQPRLLRMNARRTIEAQFLREKTARARLDNFLTGIGTKMFWVPLWHEQFRPTDGVASSDAYTQFPATTLALREFVVGDRVLVNAGDPSAWEILTIESADYDLDRVYWAEPPAQDWPSGSRIIPLRRARMVDQAQLSAPVDRVGRVGLRFDLVDPEYRFGASWGAEVPVWPFKINRGEDITFAYSRNFFTLDNDVGPVDIVEPGDVPLIAMRSSMLIRGRSSVVAFRRFIDMAAGRAGRFYMPTLMSDLEPVGSSISGVTVDCRLCGFTEYSNTVKAARSVIAVLFNNGTPPIYRNIENVARVGNVERVTLDEALPSIQTSTIERLQFMVPSRFDQDTFELDHVVDSSAAIRTAVVTRSTDNQNLAAIES